MRHPFPWHPLVLAAYPVIFLYALNADQVPGVRVIAPLALVVGVAALGMVGGAVALHNRHRGALVMSALILLVFSFGHLLELIGAAWRTPLLVTWGLLALGIGFLAGRLDRSLPRLTRFLNTAAVILVATALATLIGERGPALFAPAGANPGDTQARPAAAGNPGRDIFYLVFDRYGGEAGLEEQYGVDNRGFLARLQEQGFFVADRSFSNYLKTNHSLAASLNYTYLDRLSREVGSGSDDWRPVDRLLQDHAVGSFLQSRGYRYVHIGSWWGPTDAVKGADQNLNYDPRSEFATVLLQSTVLPSLLNAVGVDTDLDDWEVHYRSALYQFDQLERLAEQPGGPPTFVFAHILLPHPPYVFTREGEFVPKAERGTTFEQQLTYANRRIEKLVELLLDGPEEEDPVVIIQGDEGPFPDRYAHDVERFDWRQATDEELLIKTNILNAYYLPGEADPDPYPTITPVNSFRLVFDRYFGTDLPLLEDRSFIFIDEQHLYDFIEVTGRLRRGE
jgi:hypothetical protein